MRAGSCGIWSTSASASALNQMIRQANKAWHGVKLGQPDWSYHSHSLALEALLEEAELHVYAIFNAYWEPLEFELPTPAGGAGSWRRWIDTALELPSGHRTLGSGPLAVGPDLSSGLSFRRDPVRRRRAAGIRTGQPGACLGHPGLGARSGAHGVRIAPGALERQPPGMGRDELVDAIWAPRSPGHRHAPAAGDSSRGVETSHSRSMPSAVVNSVWSPRMASRISRS